MRRPRTAQTTHCQNPKLIMLAVLASRNRLVALILNCQQVISNQNPTNVPEKRNGQLIVTLRSSALTNCLLNRERTSSTNRASAYSQSRAARLQNALPCPSAFRRLP